MAKEFDLEKMTQAERDHLQKDIIHKLFVISTFHNHVKQINKKKEANKPKRGALA